MPEEMVQVFSKTTQSSADVNNTSLGLIHLPHCETNQIWSLGVDAITGERPGSIGDAGSLGVVYI